MKRLLLVFLISMLTATGCVTLNQGGSAVSFRSDWAVLPFINNTETPYAGDRAEAIAAALLYARGVRRLERTGTEAKAEDLGTERGEKRQREALELARQKKVHYALAGTVNEWRYKVGLDGEPVAGFTLQVLELPSGRVVWSGAAGKSGWSRDAVSSVAQQVLDRLLGAIPVLAEDSVPAPKI
jgi:polysaccharide biosynthesis protein PelC